MGKSVVVIVIVVGGGLANVAVGCSGKGRFGRVTGLRQRCNLFKGSSIVTGATEGNLAILPDIL